MCWAYSFNSLNLCEIYKIRWTWQRGWKRFAYLKTTGPQKSVDLTEKKPKMLKRDYCLIAPMAGHKGSSDVTTCFSFELSVLQRENSCNACQLSEQKEWRAL